MPKTSLSPIQEMASIKSFALIPLLILLTAPIYPFDMKIPSSERSKKAVGKVTPRLTTDLEKEGFELGAPIFIRIFKKEGELEVWIKKNEIFELFKSYGICYFSGGLGPKLQVGDGQSPEGFYFVKPSALNPYSQFHLSFNLGFPNAYDRTYGRTGSALMVHGNCVSIGCYAMTDRKIEEIWTFIDAAFRRGQPFFRVHVFPFKMNERNMKKYQHHKWIEFWRNLKEGYDYFEDKKVPPDIGVQNKRYIIN